MEFLKEVALEFYTLLSSTDCRKVVRKADRERSYSNPLDYILWEQEPTTSQMPLGLKYPIDDL